MPELDHVGIAVPNLAEALAQWRPFVGEPESPPEEVPSNRVRVVFLTVGGTHLELLEPTEPSSPVARFLASRGPGVHHLAFRVPSVDRALADVAARGGQLVDRTARPGARGRRVGFAHPSAFGGVLVEFVEGP
ncbi:MAG TPA: methylmalonyl-CoA epimerase [Thermoplasmata archaeon]|nr:methylmalonyl-CoA epimerase [Thermoplasmata archaeon]